MYAYPWEPSGMGGRPSSTDRFARAMVSRAANSIHHNVFSRCITRFHGTVPQSVFATEEFSDATFIIVNAMLYNLFMKQSSPATHPTARDEYHIFMRQTHANLETALANAHLFLATRVENVQALLLGVSSSPLPCFPALRDPMVKAKSKRQEN